MHRIKERHPSLSDKALIFGAMKAASLQCKLVARPTDSSNCAVDVTIRNVECTRRAEREQRQSHQGRSHAPRSCSLLRSLDRSTRMSAKCVQQPISASSYSSNSVLIIRRRVLSLPSCAKSRGPPYDSSITCSKWAAILAPPPFPRNAGGSGFCLLPFFPY